MTVIRKTHLLRITFYLRVLILQWWCKKLKDLQIGMHRRLWMKSIMQVVYP